jgi:ribosome-associated heat shock protein Hsp15
VTVQPPPAPASARVDRWTWAVRLFRTRAVAAAAIRSGHVKVNGDRAKPATHVKPGDEVRVRVEGLERVVVVTLPVEKRVGAALVAACLVDNTPPPPPATETPGVPQRDRGAGRPTKRERRVIDRLRGR